MKISTLLFSTFIFWQCVAINVEDINLSNCTTGSECDIAINTGIEISNSTENSDARTERANNESTESSNANNGLNVDATTADPRVTENSSVASTSSSHVSTTTTRTTTSGPRPTPSSKTVNRPGICTRDVTIPLCDNLRWCDFGCNATRSSLLYNYDYDRTMPNDNRCCHSNDSKNRYPTTSILRRLASHLFCVAYDNRPPLYKTKDDSETIDPKYLKDLEYSLNTNKYTWELNKSVTTLELNFSSHYNDNDVLWKLKNKIITPMDLPQSGFTGQCKSGRMVKYLESSKWMCMQTDLSNDNTYLFRGTYENLTIVSSPHLLNSTSYIIADNQTCPENVCLPVRTVNDGQTLERQLCSNGDCRNVVKRTRYKFVVDEKREIRTVEVSFELVNTTRNFYQYFEVIFEVNPATPEPASSSKRCDGYEIGNPIVVGIVGKTDGADNATTKHTTIGQRNFSLTLPLKNSNGHCDFRERHVVTFGEDATLGCRVASTINNFTSDTCVMLQNLTFKHFFDDSTHNITDYEKFYYHVSKIGYDITNNETLNWTEIITNVISKNVITGHTENYRYRCSGLITRIKINVFYSILRKSIYPRYKYKIAGITVVPSNPIDLYWPKKCSLSNCRDYLDIYISSVVSFVDISTPSMYHYAGGPNLDISLPHDFFYPFMSSADCPGSSYLFVQFIVIIIGFNL